MIAADTSVWIEYAKGTQTQAAGTLESAIEAMHLVMPLPVLFEILSGPGLGRDARQAFLALPRLELRDGYWERAGAMRAVLLKRGFKARGMDCLVAQACIDHDVALITADRDFRHFTRHGLKLA